MLRFDLVVIGGGSAGVTAALKATQRGATVALVERTGRYGGTCRYVGCIPTKTLLHTAQVLHTMRAHAARLGLPATDPHWDYQQVLAHKDDVIRRAGGEDGFDAPHAFYEQGGHTYIGSASFQSRHEILVGDTLLRSERFIIATGSRPRIPPIDGLDQAGYRTWETIFDLRQVPKSLAIIGGGPLGIEFAQMFQRFGSRVVVIEQATGILSQADPELSATLRDILEHEGVEFRCDVEIAHCERKGDTRILHLQNDAEAERIAVDEILVAVGIQPNSETLNLSAADVDVESDGRVRVDTTLRTTAPGIYACGDVATSQPFTHIAVYEAEIAVENALGDQQQEIDERVVPWAVYTDPCLAHVGMTEAEARDAGYAVVSATLHMTDVERGLLVEQQQGLVKAVARQQTGELLGAEIVGPRADDLIHEAALAVRLRLSVRELARAIHAYPTFSQALKQIASQLVEQLDNSAGRQA